MRQVLLKMPDDLFAEVDLRAELVGPGMRTALILAALRMAIEDEARANSGGPKMAALTIRWRDAAYVERGIAEGRRGIAEGRRRALEAARVKAGKPDPYEADPETDHHRDPDAPAPTPGFEHLEAQGRLRGYVEGLREAQAAAARKQAGK